jgi:type IV pilus assembly protein PilC
MAMITVMVLVVYVLPKFETFFQSFDAKLPLPARMLLGFSRFLTEWWMVIGAILIVVVGLGVAYFRTGRGRLMRHKMMLRFPVVGDVVRYSVVERFCRILGSMLRAGVPVPDALTAATEGTNNLVFERKLAQANAAVLRGEGLSEPLAETHLFPGAAEQMLRVGEESGTLDRQLDLAADFYQGELEYKLKRLTSLFEPTVIVVMGLIVGFVAVALVSAMYGIFNQVNLQRHRRRGRAVRGVRPWWSSS